MTSTPNDPDEPATRPLRHPRSEAGIPEPRVVRDILPIYPRGRLRWLTVVVTFPLFLAALLTYGVQVLEAGWVPGGSNFAPVVSRLDPVRLWLVLVLPVLASIVMVLAACCIGRYRTVTKVLALLVVLGAFAVAQRGTLLLHAVGLVGLGTAVYDRTDDLVAVLPGTVGTVLLLVGLLGLVVLRPQTTYKRTVL